MNENYNSTDLSLFEGLGIGFMVAMLVVMVFFIIVSWKIFAKAGQPGWAVLIPVYNAIVYFRIIGRPASWLLVYLGTPVLAVLLAATGNAIAAIIAVLLYLAFLVIIIMDVNRLSRSFGQSTGFTVGLILLGIIFYPILAFGASRYVGPNGIGGTEAVNENPQVLHS